MIDLPICVPHPLIFLTNMVIATPGNSQSNPVADWLKALPPLTRIWFVAAFLNANFIYFGVISPYTITWDLPALAKFQVWRLLTSFLFVGTWGKVRPELDEVN